LANQPNNSSHSHPRVDLRLVLRRIGDLPVALLPGPELSSLIDDAMEHEEQGTEEEEISEKEDLPQGRGPLLLDD
jgi:hypothetical protein